MPISDLSATIVKSTMDSEMENFAITVAHAAFQKHNDHSDAAEFIGGAFNRRYG